MKNKKGFTIIEILITVGIIALVTVIGFVTFTTIIKNVEEKEYKRLANEFETAAEVWLTEQTEKDPTSELEKKLYNNPGTFENVTLKQLADSGLIEEQIENPKTNKKFNYTEAYVKLYYDSVEYDEGNTKETGLKSKFLGNTSPGIFYKDNPFYLNDKDMKAGEVIYDPDETFDPTINITLVNENGDALDTKAAINNGSLKCTLSDKTAYSKTEPFEVTCSYSFIYDGKNGKKTISYEVNYKSVLDGIYLYEGKSKEYTVDIPRTYKFTSVGAKGKGGSTNVGAKLYTEISLKRGDKVKIEVGGQESKFGGGLDGNGGTTNNGGDSTRVWIQKAEETEYKLAFAAAGGGGGTTPTAVGTTTTEISGTTTISTPAGGTTTGVTTSKTSITAAQGKNGTNGGGSGASSTITVCSTAKVRGTCNTYNACSACGCKTYQWSYDQCKREADTCTKSGCGCKTYKTCTSASVCGYVYYFGDNATNTGSSYPGAGVSTCKYANLGEYRRWGDSCIEYKSCSSCSCAAYNTNTVSCITSPSSCLNGVNFSCTATTSRMGSGSGGTNIVNTDFSPSKTNTSIGTYTLDKQKNDGYLQIEAEIKEL